MAKLVVGALVALVLLGALDRVLLALESRGWINYRRHGISRGAVAYQALELQSILEPGARSAIEVRAEERKRQDESGDPPAPEPSAGEPSP